MNTHTGTPPFPPPHCIYTLPYTSYLITPRGSVATLAVCLR